MNKTITMSTKELSRYEIIIKLVNKEINGTEAAKQPNLSKRQVRRLKTKVKKYGAKSLIHGNRGRSSNRRIPEDQIKEINTNMGTATIYFIAKPNPFILIATYPL